MASKESIVSELPSVAFGEHRITRLISGGNPLCGNSHFTESLDEEMRQYFTNRQVVEYLGAVEAAGINTLQARGDYHRVLHWVELHRRAGGTLHWIAQTASEMSDVFTNIRVLAAAGAIGIYHHGTQTDNWWLAGRIDEVRDYLRCMRDSGVQVGLGTHTPEVIEYAEEKGWDVDFYMASLYNLSRRTRRSALVTGRQAGLKEQFFDEDPPAMCRVVRAVSKPCLVFKVLAAGRRCATQAEVAAALSFAYANIKATDAVVVGMFPKHVDQIALNVAHALEACRRVRTAALETAGGGRENAAPCRAVHGAGRASP